jgi:hypothetical protein
MNAPKYPHLLGEGSGCGDVGAFLRLNDMMADPIAKRHMRRADDSQVDPGIARMLNDARALNATPTAAYGRWLQHFLSTQGPSSHLMSVTPGNVHIPTIDPNIFVMYENRENIADIVSPVVNASKITNYIQQTPAATLQNIADTRIANSRARPNQINWNVDNTLSYNCVPLGLIDYIPQEVLENADATPLQTTAIWMNVLRSFMDLAREYAVATQAFDSANYGSNTSALAGINRWDNPASDPIQQLLVAMEQVIVKPNTLVIGGQVWPYLRTNPAVQKYILSRASTLGGAVPMQMELDALASLIGVERVVVGGARYNSAQEGQTATSSYVWGKSAALIRVERNPNPIMTSTFMYTYRFGGLAYRNEVIPDRIGGGMGGQYIKLSTFEDDVVIGGANTGYLYTTVIS